MSGITLLGAGKHTTVAADTETFFDSGNKGTLLVLSGSDKIITHSGASGWNPANSGTTQARSAGARYAELKINVTSVPYGIGFGVVDSSQSLTGDFYPGTTLSGSHAAVENGPIYQRCYGGHATPASGTRWWDGTNYANDDAGFTVVAANDYIQLALDVDNGIIWFGKNNTWSYATPSVGGATRSFIDRTPQTSSGYRLYAGLYQDSDQVTLRTKSSEFQGTIPSGFTAWDNGT